MRRLVCLFLLLPLLSYSQKQLSASEIRLRLKKLNFLGSVLYVAAHPDDENTRVIAYLASERLAATAYLSMTRGDGGQNLIGPEIRDLLGLIRTQELLSARRIDGGQQFFTRANDFGFSKNVTEAFEIWNKNEVLSDVVRVYREFQPDVVITRFPPDERAGHGHHTGSAVLAQEAFDLSGTTSAYPDQLKKFTPWKPKRLFTNTGRWWNQTINEKSPGVVALNVGAFNPLLGKSYSEIAADSRTQHKSQGFGSQGRRGDAMDFFEFAKGDSAKVDILDGVNTTWTRVKGGAKVQVLVDKAIATFSDEKPYDVIPVLLQIRKEIMSLEPGVWRDRKLRETEQLIQASAGLYTEVTAAEYHMAPGELVKLQMEIVNRSKANVKLKSIKSDILGFDSVANLEAGFNKLITLKSQKTLGAGAPYSGPYWLREEHSPGLFKVADPELIGRPENPPAVMIDFVYTIDNQDITISVPLVYKWTDPVKGELSRPFEIVPPVAVSLSSSVYVFPDASPQHVVMLARSSSNSKLDGTLSLTLPKGWKADPAQQPFTLNKRGEEQSVVFTVTPSKEEMTGKIGAAATVNGKVFDRSVQMIGYDHIPVQTLVPPAYSRLVRTNISKAGSVVAYIKGAGDEVPGALRNLGYEVWEMKNEEVTPANLAKVDAVVLGVRALNTNERVRYFMPDLLKFTENGGTLIVQYNTNFEIEIDPDKFSPYPLTISRDRVTDENSEVRILKPDHPALNYPNKITASDFTGWVQERGLYYPNKWDEHFEALISSNDKGEDPKNGGLLVAKYGKGHYVYTGLSFFRELPEGVPGAYKLFANMVSLGKMARPADQKVKQLKK
ncbi:MAG TPA: PIG-L family deacetylase [Cyclobacteriaceae bacterium]|nr:PIG-L family deacetylase [Cyclobacteriaceae bacterium]